MYSALIGNIPETVGPKQTDGLFVVCEEKHRAKRKKARMIRLHEDGNRTKHSETKVREKTNDEEKWKLCFQFSISML